MALRLKPLNRQVIAITGASSGVGLTTARNEEAFRNAAAEIDPKGGRANQVAGDVVRLLRGFVAGPWITSPFSSNRGLPRR